jgi:hypothetical protein
VAKMVLGAEYLKIKRITGDAIHGGLSKFSGLLVAKHGLNTCVCVWGGGWQRRNFRIEEPRAIDHLIDLGVDKSLLPCLWTVSSVERLFCASWTCQDMEGNCCGIFWDAVGYVKMLFNEFACIYWGKPLRDRIVLAYDRMQLLTVMNLGRIKLAIFEYRMTSQLVKNSLPFMQLERS